MISAANTLKRFGLTLSLVVWAFFLSACSRSPDYQTLTGRTMGTTWSVVFLPVEGMNVSLVQASLEADLLDVNGSMSTYIADSEINRVSSAPVGEPIVLSAMFADVLSEAITVSKLSDGAYDVTVAPLVDLWGFGPQFTADEVPSPVAIQEAMSKVGYTALTYDPETKTLIKSQERDLDFSSIAKGYGVQRLADLLEQQGVEHYLVEIGGELLAKGLNPKGQAWKIAVRYPDAARQGAAMTLNLDDVGVATSGDYFNFFQVGGQHFSHLIDPRTGGPIHHEVVSATVVDQNITRADALATTLLVLGKDRALALAEQESLAALLLVKTPTGIKSFPSSVFAERYGSGETGE